jgi:DNA transformation protein and related proteins
MSVSPSFATFVLEQLGRCVTGVRGRKMFGGLGIYSGELFFALVDDDVLYFKVDDSNRSEFVSRGMEPFRPYGDTGEVMQYYQVPEDLLEDVETLGAWAAAAIGVAERAKTRPRKPRR